MGVNTPGISIFSNMPALPLMTTGRVFWVGNSTTYVPGGVAGVDSGAFGDTPQRPFATWDFAVGQCTGGRHDQILILPGHAETITNTARVDCDVAAVQTIGLGSGGNRPTFTFATDTTADINIDAANVTFDNLAFVGNIAALAAPIDVNAAAFTMRRCDWFCAAATTDVNVPELLYERQLYHIGYQRDHHGVPRYTDLQQHDHQCANDGYCRYHRPGGWV